MTKVKLTGQEIRILELATDVLEKILHAKDVADEFLHEHAEHALEEVRCVRDSFGKSILLTEEP